MVDVVPIFWSSVSRRSPYVYYNAIYIHGLLHDAHDSIMENADVRTRYDQTTDHAKDLFGVGRVL